MSMSVRAEVDARDMARVARVLRSVDKSLIDDLRDTMRPALQPIAGQIATRASSIPPPMSGFVNRGRKRWGGLRAMKVSVTPGYSRKNQTLVSMNFATKGGEGMYIADMAGSKNLLFSKNPRVGRPFIENLNRIVSGWDNGGRFLYRTFMPYKPVINRLAENILLRWIEKTNRELEKY
jgi:hypothetical protein